MRYKIVEYFGPNNRNKWDDYLRWRKLDLSCFDSIDCGLRPDLFEPESMQDWCNCVNQDYKLNLITNLDYAKAIFSRYVNAVLVGVDIALGEDYILQEGLLGFDIIDGYCDVSLVTNWGTDAENLVNPHIMPNGLIADLAQALQIRNLLRQSFAEDPHAEECEVWAVYQVNA